MRFKRRRAVLLLSALSLGFSLGCGIKLGAHPDDQPTVQVGGQTECLTGGARKLSNFLHGTSTPGEIGGLLDCARSSLSLFENETQGQIPGQWQPSELKKFLERYFLNDEPVDDGLVSELMLLKQTLLGGGPSLLTERDLDQAQLLIAELKTIALEILPFMSQLDPDSLSRLSRSDLQRALSALKKGATDLGQILEQDAAPYQFAHFDALLTELEGNLSDVNPALVEGLRTDLPLIQNFKRFAISSGAPSDSEQMTGADWRNLLTISSDLYSIYIRFLWARKNDPDLSWGAGLDDLASISWDTKSVIEAMIDRNIGQMISFKNLDQLIDTENIFDFAVSAPGEPDGPKKYFNIGGINVCRSHVKETLRLLARQFMTEPKGQDPISQDPAPRAPVPRPIVIDPAGLKAVPREACGYPGIPTSDTDGVTKEHIERFWRFFELFLNGQRYLQATFSFEAGQDVGSALGFSEDSFNPASLASPALSDLFSAPEMASNPSLAEIGARLRSFLGEKDLFPLFKKDELRAEYNGFKGDRSQSFSALTYTNAISQLVRFILTSYIPHWLPAGVTPGSPADLAQREKEIAAGATKKNIEDFYWGTRDVGIDFKLYDPILTNTADKRQLEASLFTFHSVGGPVMLMEEGTDYISTLLSSKLLSSQAFSRVNAACQSDGYDQCLKQCSLGLECASWCSAHNPNVGPVDVFGDTAVGVDCFRKKFFGDFIQDNWDHMPGLYDYYSKLPPRPPVNPQGVGKLDPTVYRETVACFMEQVARSYEEGEDWIDAGDVDEFAALSHYLEALFTRFDRNGDGFIDFSEGMQFFPILDPLLIEAQASAQKNYEANPKDDNPLRSLTSDDRRLAALTYMLATGDIPSTADFIWWEMEDFLDFENWFTQTKHAAWQYHADRGRVLQIMGLISALESSSDGVLSLDTQACFRW